jgi:hypothetical protein
MTVNSQRKPHRYAIGDKSRAERPFMGRSTDHCAFSREAIRSATTCAPPSWTTAIPGNRPGRRGATTDGPPCTHPATSPGKPPTRLTAIPARAAPSPSVMPLARQRPQDRQAIPSRNEPTARHPRPLQVSGMTARPILPDTGRGPAASMSEWNPRIRDFSLACVLKRRTGENARLCAFKSPLGHIAIFG